MGEGVTGANRIRNEKLKEHRYMGEHARCSESKKLDLDEERNV